MTEPTPAEAGPGDPASKTVLLVDDDEDILTLLEILIHRDGFRLELAADGEAALAKLKGSVDALVLDLMLPGKKSGFEVLAQLRAEARRLPVVVITALAETKPELQVVAKDPNVVALLRKPIHQKKLLETLHRALKTRPPAPKPAAPRQEDYKI